MKLITRDTDYALRALGAIASSLEKTMSAAVLVEKLNIPKAFLRKILQRLHQAGILEASKGHRGGFRLAVAVHQISLIDLMNTFQGPLKLNECLFKKKICPDRNTCLLREKIETIEQSVRSQLKSITVGSLLKKKGVTNGKKKNYHY